MRKRRGLAGSALGLAAGLLLGVLLLQARAPGPAVRPRVDRHPRAEPVAAPGNATGLLYVGVMTARKYLGTRACAVYESWGRELGPGRIGFYSSEDSRLPAECPSLPLVPLRRVDDSYPPQKKSFMMLEHMWRLYGERFEWFLRADDDLYVRTDRLQELLRSVDSRRPSYIGQAGRGNSLEFGLLSLEYDENFCMGGPGVVLSRETLRRIVPHIRHCLQNLYTSHEDVELGRCVRKFAGISCTWNYEMQSILYHNSSGDLAFTGKLKTKEVHRAISMHPVKSAPHMYRLHNYMRGLKIQELQQLRIELQRDIDRMTKSLGFPIKGEQDEDRWRRDYGQITAEGRRKGHLPKWDFVSRSEYSLADSNPRRRLHSDLKEGLEDATRQVMASINACSRQRGRFVEERQALYGYRSRTVRGVDTVLDLLLLYKKYRGRKVTLPVRRHLYLHQHYTGLETRELPTEDLMVHFIVPVSGRRKTLLRFLLNYEKVCLFSSPRQQSRLILVLYPSNNDGDGDDEDALSKLIERLQATYGEESLLLLQGTGKFSRARALDRGASQLQGSDLMFFIDVDIGFNEPALLRIRRNVLRARRIYFPVVFSQYDPKISRISSPVISEAAGFWRIFGFGIAAMYKSDYDAIGRFDLTIEGWGKEDVDLYEKALRSESLQVFRAPDPDLMHLYHGVYCNESLKGRQYSMCKGTRADTYASTEQLSNLVYRNPQYLAFAKAKFANSTSPEA